MSDFIEAFRNLAIPYWKSDDKWKALTLLVAIIALNLGMVYIQVLVNEWVRTFYDILQKLDKPRFFPEILRFCLLAGTYVALAVYMLYLSQMLQIRWRKWLTDKYVGEWFANQTYYRINLTAATDNPDQRISEDINLYTELTIDLGTNLLNKVTMLVSFLGILWLLSGTLAIPIGDGATVKVPGYMVWAALLYSTLGTWLTIKVGSPLVLLNFKQQRFEADFRFSMVRVRENSESIALYRGEKQEQVHLKDRFDILLNNFWKIMRRQKRLSWLTNGYGQAAVIFPILMAAPRLFAGEMQIGGLMQTAGAFGAVHGALSYLITSFSTIARWKAVIDRLLGFTRVMNKLQQDSLSPQGVKRIHTSEKAIRTGSLRVSLPDGKLLVKDLDLNIVPGTHLLITGPSGCGKSTLIRSLAGIWPFSEGTASLPGSSSIMFLPQKPYLPLGTLRNALCYPNPDGYRPEEVEKVLEQCGLGHLAAFLEKDENWSQILSLGEQQRLAFSRVLLVKPDFIFLDEATASVDEASEAALYELLHHSLPDSAVTSVGHRGTLLAWHSEKLTFEGDANWVISDLDGRDNGNSSTRRREDAKK